MLLFTGDTGRKELKLSSVQADVPSADQPGFHLCRLAAGWLQAAKAALRSRIPPTCDTKKMRHETALSC